MLVSPIPLEFRPPRKASHLDCLGRFFLMRSSRLAGSCVFMFIPISDPSTIWTCFFRNCMACVVYSCCCMCFGELTEVNQSSLLSIMALFLVQEMPLVPFLPITMADTKNPRQQKSWQSLPKKVADRFLACIEMIGVWKRFASCLVTQSVLSNHVKWILEGPYFSRIQHDVVRGIIQLMLSFKFV